jgi:hypothetical protein
MRSLRSLASKSRSAFVAGRHKITAGASAGRRAFLAGRGSLLELAGFAAVTKGAFEISSTAGWMVGGGFLVFAGYAVDRPSAADLIEGDLE